MRALPLVVGVLLSGCVGKTIVDPSIPAVEANDYTLMISACENVPARGLDICRVKAGQKIESVWRIIVPVDDRAFLGGEITVYYKDISRSYSVTQSIVEIPWKDFIGEASWSESHGGVALALAQIRYRTPEGIEQLWWARGEALLVVLKPGYDPMPVDSGFSTWGTTCRIEYSTAGRSAISCKK
jgi:hypothetical protein